MQVQLSNDYFTGNDRTTYSQRDWIAHYVRVNHGLTLVVHHLLRGIVWEVPELSQRTLPRQRLRFLQNIVPVIHRYHTCNVRSR
jgi:hypothetical protein